MGPSPWPSWIAPFHGQFHKGRPLYIHTYIHIHHNIGITIYEAKITSIEDRLKDYSKPPLLGIEPAIPLYKRSLITALAGDRTADTSGQVNNLNTNTAFKCVPHILGYLLFLQTVAELCADAHYYFAHSLNSPWGSRASSMCPVRRVLTP